MPDPEKGSGGTYGPILAPNTPEFKAVKAEAQRAEEAIGTATQTQAVLLRWLASRSPNGIRPIADAEWVQNFMTATKELTPENVNFLMTMKWELAPDLTLEQMRELIADALAGRISAPGKVKKKIAGKNQQIKEGMRDSTSKRESIPESESTPKRESILKLMDGYDWSKLAFDNWHIVFDPSEGKRARGILFWRFIYNEKKLEIHLVSQVMVKITSDKSGRYAEVYESTDGVVSAGEINGNKFNPSEEVFAGSEIVALFGGKKYREQ